MPTAVINQPHCHVHLKSERLEVFCRNEETEREELLREIPIRDLDRLIVTESVQITSRALAALLRASIPVNVLGWSGQFLGSFLPAQNAHGEARLRQYRRTLEPTFALHMAGRIISAKLYNQRRVLQRLAASRSDSPRTIEESAEQSVGQTSGLPVPGTSGSAASGAQTATGLRSKPAPSGQSPDPHSNPGATELLRDPDSSAADSAASALAWLDNLFGAVTRSKSLDELRGYEGVGTARYFQAWASFLPEAFPFERRSTRPPLNPVNACISFGATLLYSEAAALIHAHGLDPSLGLLHQTENGRWSLALDLLEPFRPVLVEALALDLFSHQILNPAHFEPSNGGIYLNETGRKKFLLQYERRMERQFLSEAVGHRTTLRQQLEQQALLFKAALEDPSKFDPFVMN